MVVDQTHQPPPSSQSIHVQKRAEVKQEIFRELLAQFKSVDAIPDSEWAKFLTPDEFYVSRQSGTEPAYSGPLTTNFKPGRYSCVCCGSDLFISDFKYSCEHGWPSFSESVGQDQNIERRPDNSFGLNRVEVRCKVCHAHLGHVFEDKHSDSNERYCINSCSVDFVDASSTIQREQA